MKHKKTHLPVFGIGPIFIIILLFITIVSLLVNELGYLNLFNIDKYIIIFETIGFIFIIEGITIWALAVLVCRIDSNIKKNKLVTNGIYRYTRNPIYSAFIFVFSGLMIINHNFILLIFPFIYWVALTIIMKMTEEKWLIKKYGQEYEEYAKRTNRCIPFFPKKGK